MAELLLPSADSLLGTGNKTVAQPVSDGTPLQIKLPDIADNPDNPRKEFESVELQELADDIAANGVSAPVSVYASPDGSERPYTLNYGHRRLLASGMAGKQTIPAFLTVKLDAYQLVSENEQRSCLAPLELALFIQDRIQNHGETQEVIAKRLNKDQGYISQRLKLLTLSEPVRDAFVSGQIEAPRAAVDLDKHLNKLTPAGQTKALEKLAKGETITRAGVDTIKKYTAKHVKKTATKTKLLSGQYSPKTRPNIDGKTFTVSSVIDDVLTIKFTGAKQETRYRLTALKTRANST